MISIITYAGAEREQAEDATVVSVGEVQDLLSFYSPVEEFAITLMDL